MEEVRVQGTVGSQPLVPRSVGPVSIKDPQQAQEAPVEQISNQVEVSNDATVLSQSMKRMLSRANSETKVQFSAESSADAAKGKINFVVVDKESGEVLRSFPDHGSAPKVSKVTSRHGHKIDARV